MTEGFYCGAYWPAQPMSVEGCADRMARFLALLKIAHRGFSQWRESARTPSGAPGEVIEPHPEALSRLLEAQIIRDDYGKVMANGGYIASVRSGSDVEVGLRVRCGVRSKWLGNAVVLSLPEPKGAGTALYDHQVARQVMAAQAQCWEPEWATWSSERLRAPQHVSAVSPVVGWMTYLAHPRLVKASTLPGGVIAEDVGGGTLITIGTDAMAVSESLVLAVRESLGDVLQPPFPSPPNR